MMTVITYPYWLKLNDVSEGGQKSYFYFCTVFGVINKTQMSLNATKAVSSYLPLDQTLKICVKDMWQNLSVLYMFIGDKVI